MSELLAAIFLIVVVFVLVLIWPLALIWAWNVLFGTILLIPYTWETLLAAFIFVMLFRMNLSFTKKKS